MKLLTFIRAAAYLASVAGPLAAEPLDQGLVAYYPFNRNASDASGNARDLTATNATLVTDRTGRPKSAYSFNGSTSILTASQTEPALALNEKFTISCWVKISAFNPNGSTLVRKDGDVGFNILNFESPNRLSIEAFRNGRQYRGFAGTPPLGEWCMLSATWDGTTFRIFVNGIAQTVAQDDLPRDLPIYPITIGGSIPWPGETFNGIIDEVRIYNRALSTEDVGALYLVKQGANRMFTGAWYETKALSVGTPSAGEIQIRLFDDNTCAAVREFNDVAFDLSEGTWRPGKKGAVLISFTSDFAGETFQGTIKNSVLNGTFSGGGFVGKFVTSSIPVADLP